MALLHHQREHAEPDERRQDRRDRRRQRDHDRPERHREHDERDADDEEQEERQALHDPVADVLERSRQARDVGDRVAALGRRRDDVVAQAVDELIGRLVLRGGVRRHEDDCDGLLVVELRLPGGGHALEPLHAVVDLLRRLLVAVHVDDDRDRAVEAGPEALGEQVVGPAGGLLLRLRALVGGAQADERRRRRQGHDAEQDDDEHGLWRARSRSGPSERSGPSRGPPPSRRAAAGTAPSGGRPCARATRSTARSSEFAISTVVSTPRAEPMPSLVTKSRPKKARPVTEIATVRPAKSTARPADAPASAAASVGESPSCRNCRKRVTMKSE